HPAAGLNGNSIAIFPTAPSVMRKPCIQPPGAGEEWGNEMLVRWLHPQYLRFPRADPVIAAGALGVAAVRGPGSLIPERVLEFPFWLVVRRGARPGHPRPVIPLRPIGKHGPVGPGLLNGTTAVAQHPVRAEHPWDCRLLPGEQVSS